jgi:acetylornithine deacetylase/succinyl-diaminopimelate desuccinylase-like protein
MRAYMLLSLLLSIARAQDAASTLAPSPVSEVPTTTTTAHAHAGPLAPDWAAVGEETARWLSGYLRVDTVNPPGNETAGARYLADVLTAEGIPSEIVEFAPGRGSLIARVEGSGQLPPLCLMSHIDVVPAETDKWRADAGPLSGAIADGYVWGRGALDMKGMGAVELATLVQLKRAGVRLKRDVILLAVADEEVDGGGARLLAEKHWARIGCSQLVNEGGLGMRDLIFEGQTLHGISVAEKGVLWVRLTATGKPGHGSRPDPAQAVPTLVRALARLQDHVQRPVYTPAMLDLFDAIGAQRGGIEGFVLRSPFLLRLLVTSQLMSSSATRAVITNTINLTNLDAGQSPNVVPSEASAVLDCRLLPGVTPEQMLETIKQELADPSIRVEVLHSMTSNESPTDDTLYRALAARSVEGRPDAAAGPVLSPGFTDSIHLRPLGVHAYGYVPFTVTLEEAETMHGHGERVSLDNLREGVRVLYSVVLDVAAE